MGKAWIDDVSLQAWIASTSRKLRVLEARGVPSARRQPVTFWAVVRRTGPLGEADYTDNRYWVERACGSNLSGDIDSKATIETLPAELGLPEGVARSERTLTPQYTQARIMTATNLEESVTIAGTPPAGATFAGAHTLAVGTVVLVETVYDRQPGARRTRRYIFRAAPQRGWGHLIEEFGDYLVLRPVGGADEARVVVKKPHGLRVSSYHGLHIVNEDGVVDLCTSTGNSSRTVTNVDDPADTEDQVVTPSYIAAQTVVTAEEGSVDFEGSLIEYGLGVPEDTAVVVGGEVIVLEDLNRWRARDWTEDQ